MLDTFDASSNLSILNTANMGGENGLTVSNPPPGAFMRRVVSELLAYGIMTSSLAISQSAI